MKNIGAVVALIVLFTANPARALSMGGPGGWWPKSWPKELEPLRKQAWTWSLGRVHEGVAWGSCDIEFKTREQFEAAWPHILKLRDKDVPGAVHTFAYGKRARRRGKRRGSASCFQRRWTKNDTGKLN